MLNQIIKADPLEGWEEWEGLIFLVWVIHNQNPLQDHNNNINNNNNNNKANNYSVVLVEVEDIMVALWIDYLDQNHKSCNQNL